MPDTVADADESGTIVKRSSRAAWSSNEGLLPEVYIRSPKVARVGAGFLAAFVAIGAARWAWAAAALFRPLEVVCAGCAPADWYRWSQLLLAVAGIPVALVTMAYLIHFAATGRIWRRWRGVAMTFGILAATWSLLWWVEIRL